MALHVFVFLLLVFLLSSSAWRGFGIVTCHIITHHIQEEGRCRPESNAS